MNDETRSSRTRKSWSNLPKITKVQVIVPFFIIIFMFSSIAAANAQAEHAKPFSEQHEDLKIMAHDLEREIVIVYDPSNRITNNTASNLWSNLRLIYVNVLLEPIISLETLNFQFRKHPNALIFVHVYQTTLTGVTLTTEEITWKAFFSIITTRSPADHVFATGNGKQARETLKTLEIPNKHKIHIEETTEVMDGQIAFNYAIWEIIEILDEKEKEYKAASRDLKIMGTNFFTKNINDILERNFKPKDKLGRDDPSTKEQYLNDFMKNHPETVRQLAGVELPFRIHDLPEARIGERVTRQDVSSQSPADDFIFGFLPDASGLQGTLGFVADKLLGVLLDRVGNALGIDDITLNQIIGVLEQVKDLVGIFDGAIDPTSALGMFIDLLIPEFPYGDKFLPYFDLFVNALPLLRGDVLGLDTVINTLLDLLGVDDGIRAIFSQITGTATSIIDSIKNNDNFVDMLISVLTGRLVGPLVNKLLSNTLGFAASEITQYFDKINSTIHMIMSFVSTLNVTNLVRQYFPYLMKAVFNYLAITNGDNIINSVSSILELGLIFLGYSDEPLRPALERILQLMLPNGVLNLITDYEQMIKSIITTVDETIQQAKESVTDLKNEIGTILNEYASAMSNEWKSFIKDFMAFITAIKNDAFDITNNFPTISTLLDQLLTILRGEYSDFANMALSTYEEIKSTMMIVQQSLLGILAIITDKDAIKRMVVRTVENFVDELKNNVTKYVMDIFSVIIPSKLTNSTVLQKVKEFSELAMGIYQMIKDGWDNPIKTVFQILVQVLSFSFIKDAPDVEALTSYIDLFKILFSSIYSSFKPLQEFSIKSTVTIANELGTIIQDAFNSTFWTNAISPTLNLLFSVKDLFDNGIDWIFTQIMSWLTRELQELITDLISQLATVLSGGNSLLAQAKTKRTLQRMGLWEKLENDSRFATLKDIEVKNGKIHDLKSNAVISLPFQYEGSFDFSIGLMSIFQLSFSLGLDLNFDFDVDKFSEFMMDLIFHANTVFDKDPGAILETFLSFFQLIPTFTASMEAGDFGSSDGLTNLLLSTLGLELTFSGGASIELELFRFQDGAIDISNFLKVVGWSFQFSIGLSRIITILDIITGGAGGGLNEVGKYIGLDSISITVFFDIFIEIVKKAASASGPEQNTFTFKITIGATLNIGIDLLIVGIQFTGTLEVVLTFFQDLAANTPLQIYFDVFVEIYVTLKFTVLEDEIPWLWHPIQLDLSPNPGEPNESGASGFGLDADDDGLSDDFENANNGFNPNKEDSDGDGLSDKYEYQTSNTDPGLIDTDDDGLSDFQEVKIHGTNPRLPDTDFDGLTDYEEIALYGTNAFEIDTDGDGLSDAFEVNTAWDISNVTPSVKEVIIGGIAYNDHTDPLNPDTDNDGLLDGEEGERGAYYGWNNLFDNSSEVNPETGNPSRDSSNPREPARPIIFNHGFTHPLDNDTDDDSFEQIWNGSISIRRLFLRSMTDGEEVFGIWIQFINKNGEPTLNLTRTNPVNPDTDGDTGRPANFDPSNADPNLFLNSDGYELSLDPPSDPNDGDSDDDGLIDGLEGTLLPNSNHTHYLNPDTDGDGLGDMQELLLGTDPKSADTDKDMISDGDEFFIFGTEPFLPDSDFDGLTDGEEVFIYHSNPRQKDSDGDGLIDGAEVLDHGTNPVDEDTDDDGLTDHEEIRIYRTDPRVDDMDNDGLLDGEEINIYKSDPLYWDTDNDSILYRNATGQYTFPLSDGDEVKLYGTNATASDTDKDGLSDAWELYLASGLVPTNIISDPILLNPLNDDTDGDGLFDGSELHIKNKTSLVYPFVGFYLVYPLTTRPDRADTDFDGLNDFDEAKVYFTNGMNPDTDNDTYWDSWEVFYHETDPRTNDTDGDGLLDNQESTSISGLVPSEILSKYNPSYSTNASDPDTDDDGLPDGTELNDYGTDPLNPDEDSNGIPDGYEIDSDSDLLPDGLEWFGLYNESANDGNGSWELNPTIFEPEGGPFNPDSDKDGLADGMEFYFYDTNVTYWDTDLDGFSDGLEIMLGMDPLDNSSTYSDINAGIEGLNASILLLIPTRNDGTIPAHNMPIMMKTGNGLSASQASYRIRGLNPSTLRPSTSWSPMKDLIYDPQFDIWKSRYLFVPGIYQLEVLVIDEQGKEHSRTFMLHVDLLPYPEERHDDLSDLMIFIIPTLGLGLFLGMISTLGSALYMTRQQRFHFSKTRLNILRRRHGHERPPAREKPVRMKDQAETNMEGELP